MERDENNSRFFSQTEALVRVCGCNARRNVPALTLIIVPILTAAKVPRSVL